MLEWVYEEKNPSIDIARDLLVTADQYRMPELVRLCESIIAETLTLGNGKVIVVTVRCDIVFSTAACVCEVWELVVFSVSFQCVFDLR